jgi:hypothetical protein
MKKSIIPVLISLMLFAVPAWSAVSKDAVKADVAPKAKKCVYPKSKKRAPEWICTAQSERYVLAAVGGFAKSDAGLDFMEQMATTKARVELAGKLRPAVQQKISESVAGTQSSVNVIDQDLLAKVTEMQLAGTKVVKKVFGPKGSLYVLVGFDEAGAMELKNAIAAEYLLRQRK